MRHHCFYFGNPLSNFSSTRTPNAHNILTRPRLPRTFTTSQRNRRLRPSSRTTPPASHSSRKSRASFRISASFMESIIDVTYDLVEDFDYCEWQFLSTALPFGRSWVPCGDWDSSKSSHVAHNSRQVTGGPRPTSCKTFAPKYPKPHSNSVLQRTNPFQTSR